jgi:3-hydroxyacyl-[acyl-carrier-protein] dehydratase
VRYFLIDKVTEVVLGERARGVKNVTLTEEILHDHFPDYPVMPGVLIVESIAQLGGFLLEVSQVLDGGKPPLRALLVQIQNAKFSRPAEPGDQLELRVKIAASLETAAQIEGEARVNGERVARTKLTFMLRSIDSERVHAQRRSLYRLWTRALGQEIPNP